MNLIHDHAGHAADLRHQRITRLEIEARTWHGLVHCRACQQPLTPDDTGAVCACPDPDVPSLDAYVHDLAGLVDFWRNEAARQAALLAEAQAVASEAAAMARAADIRARDLEASVAWERRQVDGFLETVRSILNPQPAATGC